MNPTRHWANAYVGRGYEACGGCWGLVRLVFAEQFGVVMPEVAVAEAEVQAPAILAASHASGWRPASLPARENDILLMRNAVGQRHVGVVIHANGALGLLHATEVRGVEWARLEDLPGAGYHALEAWRLPR